MTTYHERYWQAVRHGHTHACTAADAKFDRQSRAWAEEYERIRTREMDSFQKLEAMRRPLPNQAEIDAASVATLSRTQEGD